MPLPSQGHYVFTVFRFLTDFVCSYTYEFWLSLCKIARSSVILLLPLFSIQRTVFRARFRIWSFFVWPVFCFSFDWWLLIIPFFQNMSISVANILLLWCFRISKKRLINRLIDIKITEYSSYLDNIKLKRQYDGAILLKSLHIYRFEKTMFYCKLLTKTFTFQQ